MPPAHVFIGPDDQDWNELEQMATDNNTKAIIGALKRIAVRLDLVYDAVADKQR